MRTLAFTDDELHELREAVTNVSWLPLDGRRYRAAVSLVRKVEKVVVALAETTKPVSAEAARMVE